METTSNIIQMKPKQTAENPFMTPLPAELAGTSDYVLAPVNYSHRPLKTVPDIANATTRNKKWGAVFCVGILPGLDKQPSGPAVIPFMPSQFFDSDDLAALRARLIHELDKALAMAKLQAEDPALFEKYETEFYEAMQSGK